MKKVIKGLVTSLVFVLIFGFCFSTVQSALTGGSDKKDKQRIYSFFEERENSLDAVFLGSSTTYASWNAPVAWNEHGIAVYTLANAAQPLFATKFMIDDARKTQPHAVYIVNITHYLVNYENFLHKLLDSYPSTINKLKMTGYLCDFADFSPSKTMEFFFPIIRFHDRWSELTLEDLKNQDVPDDLYKSASYYTSYLKKAKNIGAVQADFTTYEDLDEKTYDALTDLMNYCKDEEVKVLFVVVPQSVNVEGRAGKQNTTVKILQEAGFDVLDLRRHIDEMKIDPKKDFYNPQHLNLHGSLKVTDFISEYLIEKYNFTDKRGQAQYSDWDAATREYYKLMSPYLKEGDHKYVTIK